MITLNTILFVQNPVRMHLFQLAMQAVSDKELSTVRRCFMIALVLTTRGDFLTRFDILRFLFSTYYCFHQYRSIQLEALQFQEIAKWTAIPSFIFSLLFCVYLNLVEQQEELQIFWLQ